MCKLQNCKLQNRKLQNCKPQTAKLKLQLKKPRHAAAFCIHTSR